MKLFYPINQKEVDTETLEAKLSKDIAGVRDERIVKPRRFKISEIDTKGDMNGILVPTMVTHFGPYPDSHIAKSRGRILWSQIKYAENEEAGYDAIFNPINPFQGELVHQAPIFSRYHGNVFGDIFLENKVIGDPNAEVFGRFKRVRGHPTYLKEDGTNAKDYLGNATDFLTIGDSPEKVFASWHFTVSVPELLKTRTIFTDPESTYTPQEYGKLYMVFGGIPLQAITKAKIVVGSYKK